MPNPEVVRHVLGWALVVVAVWWVSYLVWTGCCVVVGAVLRGWRRRRHLARVRRFVKGW